MDIITLILAKSFTKKSLAEYDVKDITISDDELHMTITYADGTTKTISIGGGTGNSAFADYQTAITEINAWASGIKNIGDNVFIIGVNVPDLWISGTETTSIPYTYTTDEALIADLETNGYIRVGYYKLSMLESQKVRVPDIQINGVSIINPTTMVATIPIANQNDLGVGKAWTLGGINITGEGQYYLVGASNSEIDAKSSTSKPIVCSNYQYAVDKAVKGSANYQTFVCEMSDGTTKTLKMYCEIA